jgi:NADH:ubiquinone oxidoreductase subunit 6 (subunit J)
LRLTKWRVLWAASMVVALLITGILVANLYPEMWETLFHARVTKVIGIVVALTAVTVLLAIGIAVGGASLGWTGFRGRKLWHWQEILFVPLTIALLASMITLYQTIRQQQVEDQRTQEARELEAIRAERDITQAYFEDMGPFLLQKDLRTAGENDDVRLLARARTLAVLDSVSGDRKVRVLEFMSETQLMQFRSHNKPPVISLRFADLSETRLVKRSILINTDLDRAELIGAKLTGAKLTGATLTKADLRGAELSGTDLSGADLSGANLWGAKCWAKKQLREAESLHGATMPDGQTLKSDGNPDGSTLEEWLKSKNRRKNGEDCDPS